MVTALRGTCEQRQQQLQVDIVVQFDDDDERIIGSAVIPVPDLTPQVDSHYFRKLRPTGAQRASRGAPKARPAKKKTIGNAPTQRRFHKSSPRRIVVVVVVVVVVSSQSK